MEGTDSLLRAEVATRPTTNAGQEIYDEVGAAYQAAVPHVANAYRIASSQAEKAYNATAPHVKDAFQKAGSHVETVYRSHAQPVVDSAVESAQRHAKSLQAHAENFIQESKIEDFFEEAHIELAFFISLLVLGMVLSFGGHKLKRTILFIIGSLLPVLLFTIETPWLPSTALKILLVSILGLVCGIFFIFYPKCGLAGVGAVAGGFLGRCLLTILRSHIENHQENQDGDHQPCISEEYVIWVKLGILTLCGMIGACVLSCCYGKLYCIVVPSIGAVLTADGCVQMLVIIAAKWCFELRRYFPADTPLILNKGRSFEEEQKLGQLILQAFRTAVDDSKRVVTAVERTNWEESFLQSVHGIRENLRLFGYAWASWLVIFVFCCWIGIWLQLREYRREKRSKHRVTQIDDSSSDSDSTTEPLLRSGFARHRGSQVV